MPLQCEFVGGVETEHVNQRKPDANDPEVLAVDLKISGQLEWTALANLLCCSITEINNLWHPEHSDENQNPRFPMQKKIELSNEYREHQITLGERKFLGVTIKKLSYELKKHRRILLTFSVTIDRPTDEETVFFAHILKDTTSCQIGCDPDMFEELRAWENKALLALINESKQRKKKEQQEEMFAAEDENSEGQSSGVNEDDPLYDQGVEFVQSEGKVRTSLLQRKLRIGYNRAARMIETMERNGIVTPMNESGVREVVGREALEEAPSE